MQLLLRIHRHKFNNRLHIILNNYYLAGKNLFIQAVVPICIHHCLQETCLPPLPPNQCVAHRIIHFESIKGLCCAVYKFSRRLTSNYIFCLVEIVTIVSTGLSIFASQLHAKDKYRGLFNVSVCTTI